MVHIAQPRLRYLFQFAHKLLHHIVEYYKTINPSNVYISCSSVYSRDCRVNWWNWSFKISIYIGAIWSCFVATTPTWVPTTYTPTNCGYLQFPCHNGQCIYRRYVCDGINNCYDDSDEVYCNSTGWFFYLIGPFLQTWLSIFNEETVTNPALLHL